ncbi:MAG: hypothetical protein ABFD86_04355 [Bryobacteraceae bacterium]
MLDDIRVLVVEGLHRLSRGGIELGGVLYGTRSGRLLRIEAQRPIECEHAHGPSFTLSDNDVAAMERQLAAPGPVPGLAPVGWYHSHTRNGINLSEEDLKIHNRFFPHPWQVALVLHPEKFGPVTAGFFLREADGSIRVESSYQEFEVLPPDARGPIVVVPAAPVASPPEPSSQPKSPIPMPGRTPGVEPTRGLPPRILEPSGEVSRTDPEKLGAFLERLEPRRSRVTLWTVAALLCLAAFFLGLAVRPFWLAQRAPQTMSLRAFDQGTQLRIEWDDSAAPVRQARSGMLVIVDGGDTTNIALDHEHLISGGISYARRSSDVDIRLNVAGHGRTVQEVTRFVAPPAQTQDRGAQ